MAVKAVLRRRQAERGRKGGRDAEQPDGDLPSGGSTSITSQPLWPRETRPRALGARQDHIGGGRRQADIEALLSGELHAGAPVVSASPIAPEQWGETDAKRIQQQADLAWLCGRAAIPLTWLTQRTGAAVANAGCIHQAQTAISLATSLLQVKRLPGGTAQCPISLERKVGSGEPARFPGGGGRRWPLSRGGRG